MPALRNQLIEQHVPLVRALAARVCRQIGGRLEAAELVGLGSEALVQAARRFDEKHGVEFATFVHWRVKGAMIDGVRRLLGGSRHAPMRLVSIHEADQLLVDDGDPADVCLERKRHTLRLPAALARLDARERHFIREHYFEGKTLLEVGAELGLSKSWASRVHARAIKRLARLMAG